MAIKKTKFSPKAGPTRQICSVIWFTSHRDKLLPILSTHLDPCYPPFRPAISSPVHLYFSVSIFSSLSPPKNITRTHAHTHAHTYTHTHTQTQHCTRTNQEAQTNARHDQSASKSSQKTGNMDAGVILDQKEVLCWWMTQLFYG